MSKGRYFTFSLFLPILLLLTTNSTSLSYAEKNYLWIEAESAERIEFPVEVVENEHCSNNKCIVIREGAGVGFRGAGGEAVYPIDIKSDGEYVIWGRVFWKDGCGNSFYLGIDEFHFNEIGKNVYDYVLGHQLTFGKWMWVKGNKFKLSKGKHILKIKNREDGVKLDKLLLTDDFEVIPQGFNRLSFSTTLFIEKEFIKKGESYKYKDFYSEIEYPANSNNQKDLSFLFSYIDANNYKTVQFSNDGLKINSVENGEIKNYYQAPLSKLDGKEKSVISFYYLNDQLSIAINGRDVAFINSIPSRQGFVGLRVKQPSWLIRNLKKINRKFISFVNQILNRNKSTNSKINGEISEMVSFKCLPIGPIYFEDNFYDAIWHFDSNPLGWRQLSGGWRAEMKEGFAYCNKIYKKEEAITTTGESWWRNYQYTAYVRDKRKSSFGLLFYFKDESNFYLFKCEEKGAACKFVLSKRTEGKDIILAEKDCPDLNFNRWHKVIVKVFNGNIQTYIDDENVFDVNDEAINSGKIGLYGDNQGPIDFDDIYVESIYSKDDFLIQKKDYSPVLYINDLFDFYTEDLEYKEDKVLNEASRDLFNGELAPLTRRANLLKNWYSSAGEWEIKENKLYCKSTYGISQLWCKRTIFGDISIELDFIFGGPKAEDLAIMLYQDEDRTSNSIKVTSKTIELLRDLKPISSADIAFGIPTEIKHHITIKLIKNKLICFLDYNKIIEGNLKKIPTRIRPSFWTRSGNVYIDNVRIYIYPKKEYDFSVVLNAIEDFIEWEEETPYWEISFSDFNKGLRGIIRAEYEEKGSVIWNKNDYSSNNLALGIRSRLFNLPRGSLEDSYKIGIIMCSKGSLDSGYRIVFGKDNITLYRNGNEVANSLLKDINRIKWQWYKVQKRNKLIRVYITDFFGYDRLGLEYIDNEPLDGKKIGIQLLGSKGTNVIFSPVYIYDSPNTSLLY